MMALQVIPPEDLENLKTIFTKLDKSAGGTITMEELKEGYLDVFGISLTDDEIEKLFAKLDIDQDGEITFTEFIATSFEREKLITKENLEQAFHMFDLDSDGKISIDEVKKIIGGSVGKQYSDDDLMQIFEKATGNNSG